MKFPVTRAAPDQAGLKKRMPTSRDPFCRKSGRPDANQCFVASEFSAPGPGKLVTLLDGLSRIKTTRPSAEKSCPAACRQFFDARQPRSTAGKGVTFLEGTLLVQINGYLQQKNSDLQQNNSSLPWDE